MFDWDAAIDKARTGWTQHAVQNSHGEECAIGILASVSGMDLSLAETWEAVDWVASLHPEVLSSLYAVLEEQEPENMVQVKRMTPAMSNGDLRDKAEELVTWNDSFCPGGERLATYLEKAKVL